MKCLYISICIFLSAVFVSKAEGILDFRELRYDVQSGMTANEVNSMIQDANGFLWFATNNGISRFDGYQFSNFRSNYRQPEFFASNTVLDMDSDGSRIWFVTPKGLEVFDQSSMTSRAVNDTLLQKASLKSLLVMDDRRVLTGGFSGLFIHDPETGLTERVTVSGKGSRLPSSVRELYKDRFGNIWIGTWGNGLYQMMNGTSAIRRVRIPSLDDDVIITSFAEGPYGDLFIGTWESGIIHVRNIASTEVEVSMYVTPKSDPHHVDWNIIFDLEVCDQGYLWAGSPKGLRIFDIDGADMKELDYRIEGSSEHDGYHEVKSIFKDKSGVMWVSDLGRGVCSLTASQSQVDEICLTDAGLNSNCVMAVHEDKDDILWLGVNGEGVLRYDLRSRRILDDRMLKSISPEGNAAVSFVPVPSRNLMFVSMRYHGVYMLRMKGGKISGIRHFNTETPSVRNAFTDHAVKDADDNIWVGTRNGVMLIRPDGEDYSLFDPVKLNEAIAYVPVRCLCADVNGNIWLGTNESGIVRVSSAAEYDEADSFSFYNVSNGKLNGNTLSCIYQDRAGRVWAGTKGSGLSLYDSRDDRFVIVDNMHLFPSDEICSITEDNDGRLWISTGNGIVCYDPNSTSDIIHTYGSVDGLNNLSFMPNSAWTDHRKVIYGGYGGLSIFTVDDMFKRENSSRTVITDISIFNNSISSLSSQERARHTAAMPPFARKIRLGWKDKSVSFTFASPDFINSSHVRYAYTLEGLDKAWHHVTSSGRTVTYNNLRSGEYVFKVKSAGPSGTWTEPCSIEVKVTPAPWLSVWAILLYFLLALITVCVILQSFGGRMRLRQELAIEQMERIKSDEVNDAKLTFFTNVSHEIFTPLTIMSVSLEKLMEKLPEEDHSLNRIIRSNMDRLKRLLQQVMEFRKAESSNLKLKVKETDIVSLVSRLCDENFAPLVDTDKNIGMMFSAGAEHLVGYVDTDKLDKILYNLISNAYKYNRKDGSVMVDVSLDEGVGRYAVISVRDTGYGISPKRQEGLFRRFYDGDYRDFNTSGTGIGLSLTKDLVELHKGTIAVQSIEGEGSVFTIRIPIDREAYAEDQISQEIRQAGPSGGQDVFEDDRSTLLLVEDNEEFLYLMKNIMSERYNVLAARNGKEALDMLVEGKDVDLVITDFMMPVMDGAQLCRAIRSDIKFSHLPVVMLSARTVAECKLESFAAGVDAYVAKPFEIKVLQAQVDGMIENRKRIVSNYRTNQDMDESGVVNTDLDRQFIEKAVKLIEEHISEPEFNINDFNQAMNMSGSTLYRKIKGLTGMSPKEFIRNIRFKYACRLLLEKSSNIAEVAYMVGFSDAKYFSLCFKKEFGMTPSRYISLNRKDVKINIE